MEQDGHGVSILSPLTPLRMTHLNHTHRYTLWSRDILAEAAVLEGACRAESLSYAVVWKCCEKIAVLEETMTVLAQRCAMGLYNLHKQEQERVRGGGDPSPTNLFSTHEEALDELDEGLGLLQELRRFALDKASMISRKDYEHRTKRRRIRRVLSKFRRDDERDTKEWGAGLCMMCVSTKPDGKNAESCPNSNCDERLKKEVCGSCAKKLEGRCPFCRDALVPRKKKQ